MRRERETDKDVLHVRVDDRLMAEATERLSNVRLTFRCSAHSPDSRGEERPLPASLTVDPDAYDSWLGANAQEVLADSGPATPHPEAMDQAQALTDKKRRARSHS